MTHIIKMNCSENHQMPPLDVWTAGGRFRSRSRSGRHQVEGTGGAAQPGRDLWVPTQALAPARPQAASFHPHRPRISLLLLPKQPTPISSHVTEVSATDFLGKRAFQSLICNLFYQAAYFISRPGHMVKHLCKVEGGRLEFASLTPRLMDTCRAGVTGCDLLSHDFICISVDWTCCDPLRTISGLHSFFATSAANENATE